MQLTPLVTTLGGPYFGNAPVLGQGIHLFIIIWEKNPTDYYFSFVVPAKFHGKRGGKKKRPSISKKWSTFTFMIFSALGKHHKIMMKSIWLLISWKKTPYFIKPKNANNRETNMLLINISTMLCPIVTNHVGKKSLFKLNLSCRLRNTHSQSFGQTKFHLWGRKSSI